LCAVSQVANYESLLRRVLRRAPATAVMSVALFPLYYETVRVLGNTTATTQVPYPFHSSGKLWNRSIAKLTVWVYI
jgi:hypothetical protein